MGRHLPFFLTWRDPMNEQHEESGQHNPNALSRSLPITTRRLVLRQPEPEDAKPITEVANNMAIASQMRSLPHPYSEKNAESWIAASRANTDALKVDLVIVLKEGAVAGAAGIGPSDNGETRISYFLGESYWGQGLATEAAQSVLDMTFTTLDIERIIGRCSAANRRSRRVMEKCGFQHSRSGMGDCLALNATVATEEFVLERAVWVSLKQWSAN